jgi:hypothetical protein
MAEVVHLRRRGGVEVVSCDVYIGRPMYQGGWRLAGSKWANPFRIGPDGDRAAVLAKYEAHVRQSPQLLADLPELRGKRLGCWCVEATCLVCRKRRGACDHLSCHGEVLLRLLAELPAEPPPAESLAAPIADDDPFWDEYGL